MRNSHNFFRDSKVMICRKYSKYRIFILYTTSVAAAMATAVTTTVTAAVTTAVTTTVTAAVTTAVTTAVTVSVTRAMTAESAVSRAFAVSQGKSPAFAMTRIAGVGQA